MIKILYISSSLPPNYDSQTIRNIFFLKALDAPEFDVTLLIPQEKGREDKKLEFIKNKIYVGQGKINRFENYFINSSFPGFLKYVVSNLLMYLTVPDKYILMKNKVVVSVKDLEFDVIISASGAYSAHSWAASISKSRDIKHVAELGDPWSDNPIWPESMLYRRFINRMLEKMALLNASLIFTTNESTSSILRKKFNSRVVSIPMGYSSDELDKQNRERLFDKIGVIRRNKLIFGYVGVSFKNSRDLSPLIEAVGKSDENLIIVGPHSASYESMVRFYSICNVYFMDKVSYQKSLSLSVDVDVSIVIGNTGGLQIPGKLYLALGVSLPLLYITQCDNDPSLALLEGLPGVYISKNTVVSLQKNIKFIVENYDESKLKSQSRACSKEVQRYEWGSVGKEFSCELLELMGKSE